MIYFIVPWLSVMSIKLTIHVNVLTILLYFGLPQRGSCFDVEISGALVVSVRKTAVRK